MDNLSAPAAGAAQQHMFTRQALVRLMVPVILEQFLTSLMGTMDTIMVSNVGSAAMSSVSLVDSINVLIIQVFSALTAGGAILCAQYTGRRDKEGAEHSAQQLIFIVTAISVILCAVFMTVRRPLLRAVFGSVDADVMADSQIYFFYTVLSYPFIALFDAGSSIFRAQENTRLPLTASIIANIINIAGNAICIFGLGWGVAGAAIPTLLSRIFGAAYVLICLAKPGRFITVRDYIHIRPDTGCIRRILSIGIPSGIENSMFQFGKLAVQSTVSTMGTVAIAAQAMTNSLEALNGIAGMGVGIAMMTVVGECIGDGRNDEAVYYIKKMTFYAEIIVVISCVIFFVCTRPIMAVAGMEPASADMCYHMMFWITIVKPVVWTMSFVPAFGMRASGDVKYSMTVSCISMWVSRVALCIFLVRQFHFGPMAVWIGMFTDWSVRGLFFMLRFHSRKWLRHKLI
jgi:putative MATE family efflux protein